jgi:hypothetical protein
VLLREAGAAPVVLALLVLMFTVDLIHILWQHGPFLRLPRLPAGAGEGRHNGRDAGEQLEAVADHN